jgi:glucosamine 6-phosphate synthetase-like amidotransferase/phosphosugar isomerase protein
MAFQNIIGYKLGQSAATTSYFTMYTTPANTRTYVKDIDICNTGSVSNQFYIHIVPSGKSADTTNALFYNAPINARSTVQWTGSMIMNAGDTIQIKAGASGCVISATGGEAT